MWAIKLMKVGWLAGGTRDEWMDAVGFCERVGI